MKQITKSILMAMCLCLVSISAGAMGTEKQTESNGLGTYGYIPRSAAEADANYEIWKAFRPPLSFPCLELRQGPDPDEELTQAELDALAALDFKDNPALDLWVSYSDQPNDQVDGQASAAPADGTMPELARSPN